MFYRLFTSLSLCTALVVASAVPAAAQVKIDVTTKGKMARMGKEMYEDFVAKGAIYPDPEVQAYVNRIGMRLAAATDYNPEGFTFTVIDSEQINAFATPGGYVYVNRGLMMYLDSEEELAGVLGHEIGHITEKHASRQNTANMANSVLSATAYILTGSADLADASNMYGTSLVRGYGRDHELEADAAGAEFMHDSGYDPEALLEVIGVLKDQEQYNRLKARESGRKPQAYHGVFSTHPRNDKRLQTVILAASELDAVPPAAIDPIEFRSIIGGMPYGKSSKPAERADDRFYHNKLNFTFAYPEEWSVDAGNRAIVARADDGSAELRITIQRRDKNADPREFLGEKLDAPRLFQSTELSQARLTGHMGVAPADDKHPGERRLALINYGGISYLFEGTSADSSQFQQQDTHFLEMIESFRPMQRSERQARKAMQIAWIQADGNTSFAQYARKVRIRDAENQLRLMNGYYPRGEPRAGEWIKIIRTVED